MALDETVGDRGDPSGEPSSTISTWAEAGSFARAAATKASIFSASLQVGRTSHTSDMLPTL
jgi:hypothetical protein